jgi:hypothetical protein
MCRHMKDAMLVRIWPAYQRSCTGALHSRPMPAGVVAMRRRVIWPVAKGAIPRGALPGPRDYRLQSTDGRCLIASNRQGPSGPSLTSAVLARSAACRR